MPKQSEKKKMELEHMQAKIKTNPREQKPAENYLHHVKEMNKRSNNENNMESR